MNTDYRIIPSRKLIVAGYNPAVARMVPHAKEHERSGMRLMSMPHGETETRLMRNQGYDVPTPFDYYYKWNGNKPFPHQVDMASLMANRNRGYILGGLGTGKTLAALSAIDWLHAQGMPPVLIIAPLSILSATWASETFKWTSHLSCTVLHGSKNKRIELLNEPADIYCINYDGVKVILDELKARHWGMIVCDESTQIKTATTKRWKAINKLTSRTSRVWGMTGTPTPQSPMDAHGQLKLITPSQQVMFKTRFKSMVMYQVSQFTWLPKPSAADKIHALMQPAIRIKTEDCIKLPPIVYSEHEVKFTTMQKKAYKQMEDKLVAQMASGDITAVNSAVKAGKLVQIGAGFLYDEDGKPRMLDTTPRLKEMEAVIQQAAGKVIVFAGLTAAVNLIHDYLTTQGYSVAKVDGSVSAKNRGQIFNDFQNAKDPQVLVAQERTASHGLTLTEANVVLWYSLPTSFETFAQANARIRRTGQVRQHYIVTLLASPIERLLLKRLKNRERVQDILLELFK